MLNYSEIDAVLEIIGTIAFASSGAMVGIRKGMDLFGILVLGIVTALGGGCVRDIILGITPPGMFVNSSYAIQALISSLILFMIFYVKSDYLNSKALKKYEDFLMILDAIGLGAFTVTGINTAIGTGYAEKEFLLIFVGMLTGVGGGIIRDVFSNSIPSIFKEQIYAVASFFGACFYVLFIDKLDADTVMILSAMIVIIIRIFAVKKNLHLPKVKI
ncbi:trimeric intracellular cation channel family protein [Peptoniphilus sp. oral taxon 386]|uniref:trimeric intracellular cation channel family protein n=1 Tax=Peptoniphilus sp. oral taxon 386 TaxID=652713 RepID=UPI0001DA99D3|nr:trimeric intracellular cation channel family protein [Peptoniphilus sp. oral taxon 386]EFI41773.1 hypothetical protein HMPREF0629_00399 [Peptoniphilus sp. oral taxon 386 str. F0131]